MQPSTFLTTALLRRNCVGLKTFFSSDIPRTIKMFLTLDHQNVLKIKNLLSYNTNREIKGRTKNLFMQIFKNGTKILV